MTSSLARGAIDAAGDPAALLEALADGAARALPGAQAASALEVERERSLGDRLAGRPGRIASLRLTGPGVVLTLRAEAGGRRLVGESARVVRGVVISRSSPPLGEWLAAFAGQVAVIATEVSGDAATAARALTALGVRPAGAEVVVDETDVAGSLASLPARVRGRLPDAAADLVERIVALLGQTLPHVAGSGDGEVVVRRTATAYLPDTLRAYLALPADWAATHVLADGTTPAGALVAQLTALEEAASAQRDAALASDATALVVNGRFLADRFGASELDLPR